MTAPPPRSRTQQPNLCFAPIDAHIQTGPDGYNPESQVPIKVFFWPEPGIRTNPERGGARALRQGAMLPRAFAVSNHQPTRFGLHDVMARTAAFAGAGAARRWSCPEGPVACTNMFRRSLMNWSIGALPGENFDTWTESIRQKSARLCIARQPCFASLPNTTARHLVCPAAGGAQGKQQGRASSPAARREGGFWAAAWPAKPKVRLQQNAPGNPPSGRARVEDLPAQGSSSDRPGATHCPHPHCSARPPGWHG